MPKANKETVLDGAKELAGVIIGEGNTSSAAHKYAAVLLEYVPEPGPWVDYRVNQLICATVIPDIDAASRTAAVEHIRKALESGSAIAPDGEPITLDELVDNAKKYGAEYKVEIVPFISATEADNG